VAGARKQQLKNAKSFGLYDSQEQLQTKQKRDPSETPDLQIRNFMATVKKEKHIKGARRDIYNRNPNMIGKNGP